MVNPTVYIEAPAVEPFQFGLDSVAQMVTGDDHVAFGFEYEPQFCGPSFSTVAACVAAASLGTVSISVSTSRVATVTGTGEPAGTGYTVNWGDAQVDTGVALDTQANTYAADGLYRVVITNPANDYRAEVVITVTNGVATGPFVATAQHTKDLDSTIKTVTSSLPLVAYNLQSCNAVGSIDQAIARASRSLELGEGRVLEDAFESLLLADAVDITPTAGTAIDMVDGLAELEQYAAKMYGGIATFHMPRAAATRLASRASVLRVGAGLETVLGGKIAAGGGYDGTGILEDGTATPGDGEQWLYATGTVLAWKGKMIEQGPVMVDNQPGVALGNRSYSNEYRALAERPWVVGYECFAAAVLVTAAACCP